jgi:hypothetical protein
MCSALALATATGTASASKLIGGCTSSGSFPNAVLTDTALLSVPSDGVVVRWGFSFGSGSGTPPPNAQHLVILKPNGIPNSWDVRSVSPPEPLAYGGSLVQSQIPVKAGDSIGAWGAVGALVCNASTSSVVTMSAATVPTAGQGFLGTPVGGTLAVDRFALIEPDVDGDGFGDETQDACPSSAKSHTACPTPLLSATVLGSAKSFQAVVTCDLVTTVSGIGTVKLPAAKGKKAKTLTLASALLPTGPGLQQTITLKYPAALKNALKNLSKKKSLKLSVAITAKGVTTDAVKNFTVKLHGTK